MLLLSFFGPPARRARVTPPVTTTDRYTPDLGENARNVLCLRAYVQLVPYQSNYVSKLLKSFCPTKQFAKRHNKEETS